MRDVNLVVNWVFAMVVVRVSSLVVWKVGRTVVWREEKWAVSWVAWKASYWVDQMAVQLVVKLVWNLVDVKVVSLGVRTVDWMVVKKSVHLD